MNFKKLKKYYKEVFDTPTETKNLLTSTGPVSLKQIVDEIYIVDEKDNVLGVINNGFNNNIQFVKPKQFIKDINTYAVEFDHEPYKED